MEPPGSLPCSQELTTSPCREPDESRVSPPVVFKIRFNIILPYLPFWFPNQNHLCMFAAPCVLHVRTNDKGSDEVLDIYLVKRASLFTYHSLINIPLLFTKCLWQEELISMCKNYRRLILPGDGILGMILFWWHFKVEGSVFELRILHINTIVSTVKFPIFLLFLKNLVRAPGSIPLHALSAHSTHTHTHTHTHWMCSFEGRGAAESWN